MDFDIINKIQELFNTYSVSLIDFPNPNNNNLILTIYQSLYTPYNDLIRMLGQFYNNYTENTPKGIQFLNKISRLS